MNLNQKLSGCKIDTGSKWAVYAAACMGISFFLRMVYYFGLVNLRDVGGMEIFFSLILPALTAVVFVLALKVPALNLNPVFLVLAAVAAVNYFFTTSGVAGILSGVLQLAAVAAFGMLCFGKLPRAELLPLAGLVVLCFRLLFVDLFGFILPLNAFALVPYVAQCADLFSLAALSLLYLTAQAAPSPAPSAAVAE